MHTKFASITGSNEVVVVSSFHIEFGATGDLNICLPIPCRAGARPVDAPAGDRAGGSGPALGQQLSRQVRSADIDVVAEFAAPSSIRELMRLKVGDVLPVMCPRPSSPASTACR